jgi:predicted nucleic acid-binding protein
MVVVDTPVAAYYLLSAQPLAAAAARFWRKAGRTRVRVLAPSVWELEIGQAVAGAIRANVTSRAQALTYLRWAGKLAIESVPTDALWEAALCRSVRDEISMRDALFVELAGRHRVPLVTLNRNLLARFPAVTTSP